MTETIFEWSRIGDPNEWASPDFIELPWPIAGLRVVDGRVICEFTDGRVLDATNLFSIGGARQ